MEIRVLDRNFNIVKFNIVSTNIIWNRRYYECGDFSVEIPEEQYMFSFAYIYTPDRPEFGIIHKVEHTETYKGKMVELKGYFYEYELNSKIIYPRYIKTGNIEAVSRDMVSRFKEDIPRLVLGQAAGLGCAISIQSTGDNLARRLYTLLKTQELSFRTSYSYESGIITYSVWQGLDRTQGQNVNDYVTFSDGFGNMGSKDIVIDTSNYKNYAVVIGNGKYEDGGQIEVIVDKSAGGYKRKVYIDQTGMRYDAEEQTIAEFKESLYQEGGEALEKYSIIRSIEFEPDMCSLVYMKDYDLGDKCDIVLDIFGEAYQARIVEIKEIFKTNNHTISLTLGDRIPTVYEKARLR